MSDQISFKVSARAIWAASKFAAKGDVRYYLNGIRFEQDKGGGCLIVATDGHRLIAIKDEKAEVSKDCILKFDARFISACAVPPTGCVGKRMEVQSEGTDVAKLWAITEETRKGSVKPIRCAVGGFDEVHGSYPDWKKILPEASKLAEKHSSGFSVNAAYLADFQAAMSTGKKFNGLTIYARGEDNSIVVLPQIFGSRDVALPMFGIVMPMKCDLPSTIIPNWITQS